MTEERPRIEDEPIVGFVRDDEAEEEQRAESTLTSKAKVVEGEIVMARGYDLVAAAVGNPR